MNLDLPIPRNGDYYGEWRLCALDETGARVPIDLTGHTFEMRARDIGGGALLAAATVTIVDALDGRVTVRWRGEDFNGYGEPSVVARAVADLKHVYPDGLRIIPVRAALLIIPEATP